MNWKVGDDFLSLRGGTVNFTGINIVNVDLPSFAELISPENSSGIGGVVNYSLL